MAFLSAHEGNFLYCAGPFEIMMEKKSDELLQKIDEVNQELGNLSADFSTFEEKLLYLKKMQSINARWEKLNKEFDRISKLRFDK